MPTEEIDNNAALPDEQPDAQAYTEQEEPASADVQTKGPLVPLYRVKITPGEDGALFLTGEPGGGKTGFTGAVVESVDGNIVVTKDAVYEVMSVREE